MLAELTQVSPFSVFCSLYLWITERDGFRQQNVRQLAERFEMSDDDFAAYLETEGLSADAVSSRDFDLSSARLDIEVAPEGVSRIELARTLYEEFQESLAK